MPKTMLEMKDGSLISAESIVAIRLREELPEQGLGPAVIVDFVVGDRGNMAINECVDQAERAALLSAFTSALSS